MKPEPSIEFRFVDSSDVTAGQSRGLRPGCFTEFEVSKTKKMTPEFSPNRSQTRPNRITQHITNGSLVRL